MASDHQASKPIIVGCGASIFLLLLTTSLLLLWVGRARNLEDGRGLEVAGSVISAETSTLDPPNEKGNTPLLQVTETEANESIEVTGLPPATPSPPATAASNNLITTPPSIDPPPTPIITPQTISTPFIEPAANLPLSEQPLPTPPGIYSWTLKVPILMYHYISHPPEDADIYRVDLSVTPEKFREQLAYLKENGYTTIDFNDLSLAITNNGDLPDKPVILTFDDGYLDNYQNAFPALRELDQKGVFFVVSEFVDMEREGYMTWDVIEEMSAAGMRIESHSRNHPDLREMSRDGLIWELGGSQETIAAHIGETPRFFAYPGGQYDDNTITVLNELGYWGAVTTAGGTWHGFDDRFEWSRVRVRNNTSLEEFAARIDPGNTVAGKSVAQDD